MSAITVNRGTAAAADYSDYVGRIVYQTDADTVALSDDPTAEVPFGVIHAVDPSGSRVEVAIGGISRVRVASGGLTAEAAFVAAKDGDTAAEDGRATAAVDGDYYVGRPLSRVDSGVDDLIPILVSVGQLNPGA